MKKLIFSTLFILLAFNLAFAEDKLPELEKIKQIKVLESTREDVKRILKDFENDDEEDDDEWTFSNDNVWIEITFGGGCAEDSGLWNVAENVVTSIVVNPENEVGLKDIKLDNFKFKKEKVDKEVPEDYDLHDEKAGVLVRIYDNEINKFVFYPPKGKNGFLCDNENGLSIISGERRLVDAFTMTEISCPAPAIQELLLSKTEITIACDDKANENKPCLTGKEEISVTTNATDPENDPLTYGYTVSAGKIIGSGHQVIWDLTGVQPGTYIITATIDDGCGFCAMPKQATVVVKE